MLLIHQHLLKNFLRNLGHTILGSLILFTLLDLLDHIGSLVDNQASVSMIARYYLYKAVWIIDQVLPISMLMATLFTLGGMARYLELTALFSSGWSLLKVTRPLIILAIFTVFFSLAWREYILPQANINRNRVWEVEIHKNPDRIRPTQNMSRHNRYGTHCSKRFKKRPASGGIRLLFCTLKHITALIDC